MCDCHNPDYDLESYEKTLDGYLAMEFSSPTLEEALKFESFFRDMLGIQSLSHIDLQKLLVKHKLMKYRKNSFVIQCLSMLTGFSADEVDHIRHLLKIKRCKSHSGILSITVFTSPYPSYEVGGERVEQRFTCNWNCHYCPNEPGQPRSYLKGEPGVMRANRYGFDAVKQMNGRLSSLYQIGHTVRGAKLEVLILGGTFTSYPVEYREEFIRDLYYAANTHHDFEPKRDRLSLSEEIDINRDTESCRIIGLTVEFRPDCISRQELYRLRSYGCTRVQLGVQHIDNDILKNINRQCTTEKFKRSLRLLKDVGYKVDIHIMANLPFSDPDKDRDMLINKFLGMNKDIMKNVGEDVEWLEYDITEPDLSADQWKLYPCETVPYTEIEKWYREGSYVPYAKDALYKILYDTKKAMYPWIRCNRIIRDIPKGYIIASSDEPNTGQMILDDLKRNGDMCKCIRCREVKELEWNGTYITRVHHYKASGGDEFFIAAESADEKTLYGFVRLRVRTYECEESNKIFPELEGCSLIRELHVYGIMNPVGGEHIKAKHQHKGIGRHLVCMAEDISRVRYDCKGVAVISGVGVQRYYEKLGYNRHLGKGDFMIKQL